MELSPFLVYLALEANSFGLFFFFVALGCFVLLIIFLIAEEIGLAKKAIFAILFFGFIAAAIPSTKTVAAMCVLPAIVNNENVQALPNDILEFVRSLIQEYTSDIKERRM